MKKILIGMLVLASVGIVDAGYLTYEHFSEAIPPCSTNPFVDCGKVLSSQYATVFGVPLALLGLLHYSAIVVLIGLYTRLQSILVRHALLFMATVGFLVSVFLVYLQIGKLNAICLYCMVSAVNSFILLPVTYLFWRQENRANGKGNKHDASSVNTHAESI